MSLTNVVSNVIKGNYTAVSGDVKTALTQKLADHEAIKTYAAEVSSIQNMKKQYGAFSD